MPRPLFKRGSHGKFVRLREKGWILHFLARTRRFVFLKRSLNPVRTLRYRSHNLSPIRQKVAGVKPGLVRPPLGELKFRHFAYEFVVEV